MEQMASESIAKSTSNELWLEVETFAAFEHCPNAGRIAFRRQGMKKARDPDRIPNLGFTPRFEYAKLLERVATIKHNMILLSLFSTLIFGLSVSVLRSGELILATVVLLAVVPAIYVLLREIEEFQFVLKQIRDYNEAVGKSLPEVGTEPVSIHWWELVKSGFNPILSDNYFDQPNQVKGRPWRLLVDDHSRKRIPVIRHYENFANKLSATHSYKMHLVFCALLVELHEGPSVDWGVVVDSKSLDCVAIPITDLDKETALVQIRHWRSILHVIDGDRIFESPPANACRFCPLGFPRRTGLRTFIGDEKLKPHYYGIREFIEPETQEKQVVRNDEDDEEYDEDCDDDGSGEYFESYARYYKYKSFEQWMKESPHRPPLRHCDCGDIFQRPPKHRYWEIQLERNRERYQRWLSKYCEM